MRDLRSIDDLEADLAAMMRSLRSLIDEVGCELAKPSTIDAARITLIIGKIAALTQKFLFFLPAIAKAKAVEVAEEGLFSPHEMHKWSELENEAYRSRTWMSQWPEIEALIRRQIPPIRKKLFEEPAPENDILKVQNLAYDSLLDQVHKALNPIAQNEEAKEKGCFADISLPHSTFLAHIHAARRIVLASNLNRPARFLDVGCGGGLKVLSAAAFFDRADGLEFDPGYVEAARDLFEKSRADRCDVIHTDALSYPHYDVYDVVYFYRPMRHIENLRKLEDWIIQSVRPRTIIIAPYKIFDHRFEELDCARVDRQVYITQTSQSDADDLRREAELMGSYNMVPAPTAPSIWDPILKASNAKGYGALI